MEHAAIDTVELIGGELPRRQRWLVELLSTGLSWEMEEVSEPSE
jgi:hypothetical protein